MDRALSLLTEETLPNAQLAVVAVGGYGRGELSPHSDIDLLFLVPPRNEVTKATLRGLLYPLWDAGFQVGHAVRTPKEAIERAARDLDAATSILTTRLVAGSAALVEELEDRRSRWLRKERRQVVRRIVDATSERHRRRERAGWVLAPELKEDVGALRDLHVVQWLQAALERGVDADPVEPQLATAGDLFLAVREALHGEVKQKLDRVRIDLQPKLASKLRLEGGADELMSQVHSAARVIEHRGGLARTSLAEVALGGPKRSGSVVHLDDTVQIQDGRIRVRNLESVTLRAGLRVAVAQGATGRAIERFTVAALERCFRVPPVESWNDDLRAAFVELLSTEHVIDALELLDHVGAWRALLPEWERIRGLAQHDPYHRYTVDGHLFVAAGEVSKVLEDDPLARIAADEAGDLMALRVAALLHDVGKGSGQNHSVAGERLAAAMCRRMGFDQTVIDEVAFLVRHHLLLVDTATRRDLDDGAVVAEVADTIEDPRRLRLLYILSIVDGRATGPAGWSEWKGALVRDLYRKVLVALETGEVPTRSDVGERVKEVEAYEPALAGRVEGVLETLPPSYLEATPVPDIADDLRLLLHPPHPGEVGHRIYDAGEEGQTALTVCVTDRPGTLARTAGVLALHRISVLSAQAFSTTTGLALERFLVATPAGVSWESFVSDLKAAYSGRLAIEPRLQRKALDYRPARSVEPEVRFLQETSAHSTVIEVRAPDALGLLYAIAAAISELDLDIHVAKIDTLGERVVDVFYVRTPWGTKLNDEQAAELERSIKHRITRLFT